jgi:anti-anti-sigma factor
MITSCHNSPAGQDFRPPRGESAGNLNTHFKARPMPDPKRIKVSDSGGVTVVTFVDSKIIDEDEIQELGQELYDLVERHDHRKFVLNFAQVEFLSSAALGKLISFEKKVSTHKGELILTNIRPEIYEVFAITKLTKLFTIKDDEADALAVL